MQPGGVLLLVTRGLRPKRTRTEASGEGRVTHIRTAPLPNNKDSRKKNSLLR